MAIEKADSSGSTMLNYLTAMPRNLKSILVAILVAFSASLCIGIYSFVEMGRIRDRMQVDIDLLSDSVSSLESELSIKSNEIKWLQIDLDEESGRVDNLCDVLSEFVWC